LILGACCTRGARWPRGVAAPRHDNPLATACAPLGTTCSASALASGIATLLPELEAIYKDLHQHPELSMHEVRTAKVAADWIERFGYDVSRNVGKTGVVGVLRNGAGPTVMLRADMDALPMTEATGLPYASAVKATDEGGTTVGVFHGCGHDMHVTWLMGAARVLSEHRDSWHGTALVVFQPGEEVGRAVCVERVRGHGQRVEMIRRRHRAREVRMLHELEQFARPGGEGAPCERRRVDGPNPRFARREIGAHPAYAWRMRRVARFLALAALLALAFVDSGAWAGGDSEDDPRLARVTATWARQGAGAIPAQTRGDGMRRPSWQSCGPWGRRGRARRLRCRS
jgi:hypothetical protein